MKNIGLILLISFLFSFLQAETQTIEYTDSWGKQGYTLLTENNSQVKLNFSLQNFFLEELTLEDAEYRTIDIPGNILPNDEGMPDLPGTARYIAVPQNADVRLNVLNYRVESLRNIELAPAPRIPWENEDGPLEYRKNEQIYSTNAFYPQEFIQLSQPTEIRGVDAIILGITPFQYNPVTKELLIYRDIEIEIEFLSSNGKFGDDRLRSRWWEPILQDVFINYSSLPPIDHQNSTSHRDGAEYLIICPDDPTFLAWADSIKVFRQEQGISTAIVTTTETGGNNVSAIENYIDNAYNSWDPAPAAILILGDYGTGNNAVVSPIWDNYCVSDHIFADVNNNDMADIILARMTAQNADHLETMVTKFINYETNPPTDPYFYEHPITALGWQTERWFQICSETVGGYFLNVHDKVPTRINAVYSGNPNSDPWSTATNTTTVLNYFGPNGLGYIPASPSELGGWTGGSATEVINAINNGAFILQHRDHGYEQGWGEPAFNNTHINSLTNTDLTFVFSINCLTGKYNYGSECFAEKFHRHTYNGENAGALGIIAASEVSYSFVNDTYVWGMYDNMWPDFMPDNTAIPESRGMLPAFGNVAGKYFLQSSNWPYNTSNKEVTYNLFHHHGDAFTTLYSEVPQNLTVIHDPVLLGGVDNFSITADENAFIALTVDNEIIATAEATGTPISITIPPQLPGSELLITITKQNYFRYRQTVPVIPPSGPYVVFNSVELDDSAGNGNGIAEFSEAINLTIEMENLGSEDATDVDVTIVTADDNLIIADSTENYGTIEPNTLASVNNGFEIDINDNIPDEHNVIFQVNATDGNEIWTSYFSLMLFAPILSVGDMTIVDDTGNNNGVLDPGENVQIEFPIQNSGHAASPQAFAYLNCNTPGITISNALIDMGIIAADTIHTAVFDVAADASIIFGTPISLNFELIAGEYEIIQDFSTQVGIFREDFENSNFEDFPWEFAGYQISWPNVDPIEDFDIVDTLPNTEWTIDTNEFYHGNASARSADIDHDQASFLQITLDIPEDDLISFWYKVACEYSPSQTYFYDGLIFFIDDDEAGRYQPEEDGSSPWTYAEYPVEAGTHTFTWAYVKDSSDGGTSIPEDCAWIDYITFPNMTPPITGTLAGVVDLIPSGNVEDVQLQVGAMITNPDVNGNYSFSLPVGIYQITASLAGYEEITYENIEVLPDEITMVNFDLTYLTAPTNLQAELNDCLVTLNWDYAVSTRTEAPRKAKSSKDNLREFQQFNIYRSFENSPYELFDNTTEQNYTDSLMESGNYGYYVTALYEQENESSATDEIMVEYIITNTDQNQLPLANKLYRNFPNPFNPETMIRFDLKKASSTQLTIYNMKGQRVKQLVNQQLSAGQYSFIWQGKDEFGNSVSSGIYFYKIEANGFISYRKMMLLK